MNKENILSKISKMSDKELLCLARNTSDVEILNILAVNANYEVRCTIAENKNTPVELLAVLAKDINLDVRASVASHKNTTSKILAKLAKDEDYRVRNYVANNPNTPSYALKGLLEDDYNYISCQAEKALQERQSRKKDSMER